MRPSLAAVSTAACLVASLFLAGPAAAQSAPAPAAASAPTEWRLRVPLDSGEVRVEVNSRASTVTVVAPSGTFAQSFDSSRPLVAWANAAAQLAAPGAATATAAPAVARMEGGGGNLTEFNLTRSPSDAGYVLSGTNGAWLFALTITPAQVEALLGALGGSARPGALAFDYPTRGRTRDGDKPDASGAWLAFQVSRPAQPGSRPPRLRYPPSLRGTGTSGTVRLSFIVDATGRVMPQSVRLIGASHPSLATAARDALLAARYEPARRDGRAVPQLVMQDFDFAPQ